ncbi:MAG: LytR/AlgR family response regulator transcription factor [Ferruginibacter sp.]
MRLLIIEDEEPAANRLSKMLLEIDPTIEVLGHIESVASAIKWCKENKMPDLVLSDIQLADGLSFEIFKAVNATCPVIFTTAYDQYAIDAFKVNSVDYLLKPIKREELVKAIEKYKNFHQTNNSANENLSKLLETISPNTIANYKTRFIVRFGDHIKTINVEDIAYFYTEDKISFLTIKEGRRFTVDFNMDALEQALNPKNFFRINRQYIISIQAITEMFAYTKSRVLIKLNPPAKHETIVSTERSADFKAWLGDE